MGQVVPFGELAARRAARTGRTTTGPLTPAAVAAATAAGERLYTGEELGRIVGRSADSLRRDRKAGMPSFPIGAGSNAQHRYLLQPCLDFWARRGGITPPPAGRDESGGHPDHRVA